MFPINEVFESIQGEARYTGTPSVFIRFQGCPVGCGWCDTKHTWEIDLDSSIPIHSMFAKQEDAPSYAHMSIQDIMKMLEAYKAKHVVLTGGEPALYDLWMLTHHICASGRTVQLETSGTAEIKVCGGTFVTISPKLDMPGGRKVLDYALTRADEIKFPVGKQADIDKLKERILPLCREDMPVWLQPLSQNKTATALCVKAATENGWNVSIQTHKFIGVR